MNYLDWKLANKANPSVTNSDYLYGELKKLNIPVVIMEPLLGGRLAKVPDFLVARLKQREPELSVASWAFRFAGTYPEVLTVLSGMTLMEHLQDNLRSYAPLKPLTDSELAFLQEIATEMVGLNTIPCNDCKYCMPCPYGIDIPGFSDPMPDRVDRLKTAACADCSKQGACPQKQAMDDSIFLDPLSFSCPHTGRVLREAARVREQQRLLEAQHKRREEYRMAVAQQYGMLSRYLQRVADGLPVQLSPGQIRYRVAVSVRSR